MLARRVFTAVRAGSLLFTAGVVAACAPGALARTTPDDAVFLAGAALCALLLGLMRAPVAHFERSARPAPESDRVALLLPVVLAVALHAGWWWAIVLSVEAHLVRPAGLRRLTTADRILDVTIRVPHWPFFGAALAVAAPLIGKHDATSLALFSFGAAAWFFVVNLAWLDPLTALRRARPVTALWRRHLADPVTFAVMAGEAAWAYVAAAIAEHDGALFGVILLAPLPGVAMLLVRNARITARLHRLMLSREAVDAMLHASDPVPQLRSLLESIDPRITREAVEIVVFGRGGAERWSRVTRFGPPLAPELERLAARALTEVRATREDATVRVADGAVYAYAASGADDGLRGALLVFRAPALPAVVASREYERAAAELGPLLGEYGAITATRTAASIDTLTGLANRRGVARALDDALSHVREGGRYAVLLLDVDHFKMINDELGHQTGDRVLARIGRIIAENVRGVDLAARFGGEEFLVLLRDPTRELSLHVAERLRAAIEASGLAYADGRPVTISIGVAYARAADGSDDVVERADRALYRAKNGGRNRVVESPLVAV